MRSIAFGFGLLFSITASARAETWLCTYADKNEPTIIKFTINGNQMTRNNDTIKFTVLINNDVGLVAADSYSEMYRPMNTPVVFGLVVVIEKRSGNFKMGGVNSYQDMNVTHGHCVQN